AATESERIYFVAIRYNSLPCVVCLRFVIAAQKLVDVENIALETITECPQRRRRKTLFDPNLIGLFLQKSATRSFAKPLLRRCRYHPITARCVSSYSAPSFAIVSFVNLRPSRRMGDAPKYQP